MLQRVCYPLRLILIATLLTCNREEKLNWADAKATLKDYRLWVHYLAYLALGVGVSSLSLFSPTIVAGLGYVDLQAQLFTVPPYACAYIVTFALAMISDRKRSRGFVAGFAFTIGAISFVVQGQFFFVISHV